MKLNKNSSIAELRTALEGKRRKAKDLQMNITNRDEWAALNTLRWELEDLDKDIYLGQFIKNDDKLTKLIGKIKGATSDAQNLVKTVEKVAQALVDARKKLKSTSSMFDEIKGFLDEVDELINIIKPK